MQYSYHMYASTLCTGLNGGCSVWTYYKVYGAATYLDSENYEKIEYHPDGPTDLKQKSKKVGLLSFHEKS